MNIIKRSGTEEVFDIDKIRMALVKANNSVVDSEQLTEEQIEDISKHVEDICTGMDRALNVEEIQDLVENEIMGQNAFAVARNNIAIRKSLMTCPRVMVCPPWLKKLKSPTERLTGFCQMAKYHSFTEGILAHAKAKTVNRISTTLELTCLLNLLRKL